MIRVNIEMIKNSYGSKNIRKINYIPREKKMSINTTINDTTMTSRFRLSKLGKISIIEIRKEFDMFDSSTTSPIYNINIIINYINYIKLKELLISIISIILKLIIKLRFILENMTYLQL